RYSPTARASVRLPTSTALCRAFPSMTASIPAVNGWPTIAAASNRSKESRPASERADERNKHAVRKNGQARDAATVWRSHAGRRLADSTCAGRQLRLREGGDAD